MDFHSVMETFAEAWVAANTHTPLTEAAEQGLINGPTNNHGAPGHGPSNHGQPINTVLQDVSNERREADAGTDTEGKVIDRLSPKTSSSVTDASKNSSSEVDTPKICSPIADIKSECKPLSNSHSGRQSPVDTASNCSPIAELKSPYKTLSNPHGKSLPVHCIIEQIPGPQACGQYVELDSYAIVPNDTLFSDLVRTALGKLGYSGAQIVGAKVTEEREPETFSDSEAVENIAPPTTREVRNMLLALCRYYQSEDNVADQTFEYLANLEIDVEKRSFS